MNRYLFDAEPCSSAAEAAEWIDFYLEEEPRNQHRWVLVLKENGEKIGTCGFHGLNTERHEAELGYDLQPTYWKQGYIHEAVGRIIDFAAKEMGVPFLRGGAFKPRTSPYDFQGLEEKGLELLQKAKDETGLLIITEVMDTTDIPAIAEVADILQVGARNMQNFKLLKALGKSNKPVMLKRGAAATIREFLLAAEHIMYAGNEQVILCERGIKGIDSTYTRNTLDLAAVPIIHKYSHLPVIVDPSHGTGRRYLIEPMSKAALISGANGLMIEVHHDPDNASSDGAQSLSIEQFKQVGKTLNKLIGRIEYDNKLQKELVQKTN